MNLFKSLFFKARPNRQDIEPSGSFAGDVRRAILLLSDAPGSIENGDVLKLFIENGIPGEDAEEIFLFLPVAFVRHLLPDISWPNFYLEMCDDTERRIKFMDSPYYQVIWHETKEYFKQSPHTEMILRIAGRSAEFQAINNLLLSGGELKDINVTPTVIIR